jgi:hypothetical protein
MTMNYQAFITDDSAICGAGPVVGGIRVTVRTVLASLAEGMSAAEIIQDFKALDENPCGRSSCLRRPPPRTTCRFPPRRCSHENQTR